MLGRITGTERPRYEEMTNAELAGLLKEAVPDMVIEVDDHIRGTVIAILKALPLGEKRKE